MAYFKIGAVAALLLLVVSCAYDRAPDSYALSQLAASEGPAPMDGSRRVAQQDCTRPVTVDRGNRLCR
jgi:hypothetical protein